MGGVQNFKTAHEPGDAPFKVIFARKLAPRVLSPYQISSAYSFNHFINTVGSHNSEVGQVAGTTLYLRVICLQANTWQSTHTPNVQFVAMSVQENR